MTNKNDTERGIVLKVNHVELSDAELSELAAAVQGFSSKLPGNELLEVILESDGESRSSQAFARFLKGLERQLGKAVTERRDHTVVVSGGIGCEIKWISKSQAIGSGGGDSGSKDLRESTKQVYNGALDTVTSSKGFDTVAEMSSATCALSPEVLRGLAEIQGEIGPRIDDVRNEIAQRINSLISQQSSDRTLSADERATLAYMISPYGLKVDGNSTVLIPAPEVQFVQQDKAAILIRELVERIPQAKDAAVATLWLNDFSKHQLTPLVQKEVDGLLREDGFASFEEWLTRLCDENEVLIAVEQLKKVFTLLGELGAGGATAPCVECVNRILKRLAEKRIPKGMANDLIQSIRFISDRTGCTLRRDGIAVSLSADVNDDRYKHTRFVTRQVASSHSDRKNWSGSKFPVFEFS